MVNDGRQGGVTSDSTEQGLQFWGWLLGVVLELRHGLAARVGRQNVKAAVAMISPPFAPILLPEADPEATLTRRCDFESESARGLGWVEARGLEPPTFCSQKRRTRSHPLAADCKRREILTIGSECRPAVRSGWEQIRRILLLFCSRKRHLGRKTGMWGFHLAPCSRSPTSRAGSASARQRYTSSAREEFSRTSVS